MNEYDLLVKYAIHHEVKFLTDVGPHGVEQLEGARFCCISITYCSNRKVKIDCDNVCSNIRQYVSKEQIAKFKYEHPELFI